MKSLGSVVCLLLLSVGPVLSSDLGPVHHDMELTLFPEENRFEAVDHMTVPGDGPLEFDLHTGLNPVPLTPGVRMVQAGEAPDGDHRESFRAELPSGTTSLTVRYGGVIRHPVAASGKTYARGIRHTPGIISGDGTYLAGSSFWYPDVGGRMVTFRIRVTLPKDWKTVSQGKRTLDEIRENYRMTRWESGHPQEEIYLIAARFTEYSRAESRPAAMVFLRTPDEELAGKYLAATGRYVSMYERLIGPYPYDKFALVENFWETGFGMPSFTLLGPRVIRFPFILNTSYPHEILHNWWGNGVFPDYAKGNWSEGLTAYLSDHLLKALTGAAVTYRRSSLQKYTDYAREGRDFPLTGFRSRHSASSEAVGYGKAMMFFHMLRLALTDAVFTDGLRHFYQKNLFQKVSWDALRQSFETVSGKDLGHLFDQWVTRTGAPELRIGMAAASEAADGHVLKIAIRQVQPGPAYRLRIPVAVTLEGRSSAHQTRLSMNAKQEEWELAFPARPLRLDVDPEFDVFRRLLPGEIPPALTRMFGARDLLVLLPSAGTKDHGPAWERFAGTLKKAASGRVEIRMDSEFGTLPPDRDTVLLGWENRFSGDLFSALAGYGVEADADRIRIGQTAIQQKGHAVVLTAGHPENQALSLTWIASDLPAALDGLGRKLPHYHKYSYLGFEGTAPANIVKGQWPVLRSPMAVFPAEGTAEPAMAELAPRSPLGAP